MVVLRDTVSGKYAIEHHGEWYDKILDSLWNGGHPRLYAALFEVFVIAHRIFGKVKEEPIDI
jgi:hypothetical protein